MLQLIKSTINLTSQPHLHVSSRHLPRRQLSVRPMDRPKSPSHVPAKCDDNQAGHDGPQTVTPKESERKRHTKVQSSRVRHSIVKHDGGEVVVSDRATSTIILLQKV